MQPKTKQERKKTRILRWNGLLSEYPPQIRWAVGIALSIMSAVLAFTQLGFVELDLPSGNAAYVVVLLPVVALGTLLLGTLAGTLLGLTAGAVLYVHAQYLPLDHFELLYVTPMTSIFMLGLAGFTLGILFAFALRHDPPQVKRVIYITIITVFVAWAYSLSFGTNTFILLIIQIAETAGVDASADVVTDMARQTANRLGSVVGQAWLTAALAAIVCSVADYAARKVTAHQGPYGLRVVFSAWLSVAIGLTFMAMAAASFAVTTGDQLNDAERNMSSDLDYLSKQIEESSLQAKSLNAFVKGVGLSYDDLDVEDFENLVGAVKPGALLKNYDRDENGTAIVIVGQIIDTSNDERFPANELVDDVLSDDMIAAVDAGIETNEMQRFVYDGTKQMIDDGDYVGKPYIAYLLARELNLTSGDGDTALTYNVVIFQTSEQVFKPRGAIMQWLTLSSLALMLIVSAIVLLLLNRVVAQRIDEENEVLGRITAGDLNARATAGGTSEFDSLTNGINETVDTLKGWIAEAETRMDAELATAKAIQESALPRTFPPFPDLMRFDIYASMQPAKQVGGDFYDFFLVGEDCDATSGKLAFVVADVSGKGVPAALFMMKAKALIRDYVGSGMELGEAIAEANAQICDGNDAGMFVTAWVGLLDYGTGHVDYVNAGHNPPLLWAFDASADTASRTGAWRWITERSGLPLGLFDGMPYTAHSLDCLPGDTFILYSDGVTEAMSATEELYGEDRLMALAEKHYLEHPQELLASVRRDVAVHAEGAEQSDDITILTLEIGVPPEITAKLEVPAETSQIHAVNEFLHAELDRRLCPKRVQSQLDLVIEELFVNVCRYAYPDAEPDKPGTVRIQRTYSADPPCVKVDLVDKGIPFNPLDKPDVELPTNIDDLTIGGLGLFMVKNLVDDIAYERVGENNVVTITKKW